MSFFERMLDKVLKIKQENQLKALAIFFFAIIALILVSPVIRTPEAYLPPNHVVIVVICLIAIGVVALGDRITSLKISKEKLELTLSQVKGFMEQRFEEVESEVQSSSSSSSSSSLSSSSSSSEASSEERAAISEKVSEAKEILSRDIKLESPEDIVATARDIGNLLGMFEEIQKTRRSVKAEADRSENDEEE